MERELARERTLLRRRWLVALVVAAALILQLRFRWSVLQVIGADALVRALLTGLPMHKCMQDAATTVIARRPLRVAHHDEAFLRRAAEAKARVAGLDPADLEQQLKRGVILIGVREPAEIKSGTIRNAHNIPLDGLTQEIDAAVPDRSAPTVCLCRERNRGAMSVAALLEHGYSNVKTLARGLEGGRSTA